ncbi:hypothetical protein QYF36_020102 [Acer negundo]|nr:hypothetical protein QYF36_020102 [Acer negundo]
MTASLRLIEAFEGESVHLEEEPDSLVSTYKNNYEGSNRDLMTSSKKCVVAIYEQEILSHQMERSEEVKSQGVRTRSSRSREQNQTIQEEVDIELVDVAGKHLSWSLEEEITKVIKTGVTIGAIKTRLARPTTGQAEKTTPALQLVQLAQLVRSLQPSRKL